MPKAHGFTARGRPGRARLAATGGVDAIYGLVGAGAPEEIARVLHDRSKPVTAADREALRPAEQGYARSKTVIEVACR